MHLPFDVLVSVFYYLDPLDIISFSRTCTAVHEAASARSVWMAAFQATCFQNGIFTPAFQFDDMSTLRLKQIATGPSRMLKILHFERSNRKRWQLIPVSKYPILHSTTLPASPHILPNSLYLVPGGRLLVALSGTYISVVDVERAREHGMNADNTSSKQLYSASLMAISPTKSGDNIQIVACNTDWIASATIYVWEYNTKRRSLEKVASTTLANTSAIEISSSCLAGGLFIYCNNRQNTVNIWDFTAGLWAVLSAPSTFSTLSGTLAEVMYESGKVILIGHKHAAIWDHPKLNAARQDAAMDLTTPPPLLLNLGSYFPIPIGQHEAIRGLNSHRWDQHVDREFPLSLDIQIHQKGSFHIRLNPSSIPSPPWITASLSCLLFRDSGLEGISERWRMKQRYCQGAILRTWYAPVSGTFYIYVLPSAAGDAEKRGSHPPVHSLRPACKDWLDYSFDPTSGRVCALNHDGEIFVFDYLSEPAPTPTPTKWRWVRTWIGMHTVDYLRYLGSRRDRVS